MKEVPDDLALLDVRRPGQPRSSHGVDHTLLVEQYRVVVVDEGDRLGYAYLYANGRPYLLAATDDEIAGRLLWEAWRRRRRQPGRGRLPDRPARLGSGHRHAAGLELHNRGFLALRGMEPPSAYLPSGHFL